ncbi:MAG: glutathione S-transferase family protein [Alphaproteobacteria bacterium]
MKLYIHPISTPALTVEFAAHAMVIDFERNIIDLSKGEQRSPEYLAINPKGKVPALDDNGFLLSESAPIMRYLARKGKSELYPAELKARAFTEQWMDFAAHHVRSPLARIQFNRLIAPMIGQPADEASVQMGLHLLAENLPHIEAQLASNDYLAGETLTLADFTLLGALDPVEVLKVDLTPYSALSKWRNGLRKKEFYTKVHTHFGAELGL